MNTTQHTMNENQRIIEALHEREFIEQAYRCNRAKETKAIIAMHDINQIESVLSKYDKAFSRIPCWEDGDTPKRVELLCEWVRKSIQVEETFCLQGQPREDEIMAMVGRWFNRRATTKWSAKETKALKAVLDLQPMDDEIAALDRYYSATIAAKDDYRRRDVVTLLNNWQGEVDRARKWIPARSVAQMMGVRV